MRRRPGRLQAAHEESCCQDPITVLEEPTLAFDATSGIAPHPSAHLSSHPSPVLQPAIQQNAESTKLDLSLPQHKGPTQYKGSTQHKGSVQHEGSTQRVTTTQLSDLAQPIHSIHHASTSQQAHASTAQVSSPPPQPTLEANSSASHQLQNEQLGNAANIPCKADVAQTLASSGKRRRSRDGAPLSARQHPLGLMPQSASSSRLQDRSLETYLWHAKRMHMVHRYNSAEPV